MRTRSTISGSELLLGMIAIRLAVLVLAGWCLALLPQQTHHTEIACAPSLITRAEAQPLAKTVGSRVIDTALNDMRLHD